MSIFRATSAKLSFWSVGEKTATFHYHSRFEQPARRLNDDRKTVLPAEPKMTSFSETLGCVLLSSSAVGLSLTKTEKQIVFGDDVN